MPGTDKLMLRTGKERGIFAALLIFTTGWCLLIFLPVLLKDAPRTSFLIRALFAPLCHQLGERSFIVAGITLPVCARCTGIYLGFLAGILSIPILPGIQRFRFKSMLIECIGLLGISWAIEALGLISIGNLPRAILSSSAGYITALIVFKGLIELAGGITSAIQPRLRKTYG